MSNDEVLLESEAAFRIVRIAKAYCDAQGAPTGLENPPVSDRQWQASCAVAVRFLADPKSMTAELCHHEWRLSQMRSSHPAYWPAAVLTDWSDLPAMDRYVESAGVAAMRSELAQIMSSQENSVLEILLGDAQPNQETENGEARR